MKCNALLVFMVGLGFIQCNEDWDYLLFSQRWPITACTEWEDHNKNNTCVFPESSDIWTIHGIWPTKTGTKGPWNCNSTWHFDPVLLQPIKLELEEYWTNVEGNTQLDSLWKHEWVKHGTCAATLLQLDNEFKYFNKGLYWIQNFNMKDILPHKQILPGTKGYSVQEIFDAVCSQLGEKPVIQCIIDRYTKQQLISEIRICFNRSLDLIDCMAAKDFGDFDIVDEILTNCDVHKPIMYPDSLLPYTTTSTTTPTATTVEPPLSLLYSTRERLLSLYNCIKVLIWLSL